MAKNKGITLLSVVITITATIILAAIFVSAGLDTLEESKVARINNEIGELKRAIATKYTLYNESNGEILLPGTPASTKWANPADCAEVAISTIDFLEYTATEQQLKSNIVRNEISRDYEFFVKVVSSKDAEDLGAENITSENKYIINYNTGSVYGPIK